MGPRGYLLSGAGLLLLALLVYASTPFAFTLVAGGSGLFWTGTLVGMVLAGALAVTGSVLLLIGAIAVGVRVALRDAPDGRSSLR
jgi:apolipoprotein N-acyltransferase